MEETATDKGTLITATSIPTQGIIVEATTAGTVEATTAVEDKDIQSRATKTLPPKMMTTAEEAATDKITPTRATKMILTWSTKQMIMVERIPRSVQAHGNAVGHVEQDIRMQNKFVMAVAITCVTPTTLIIGAECKHPNRLQSQPIDNGTTLYGVTTDGMVATLGAVVRRAAASGEVMVHAARHLTHVHLVFPSGQTR